MSRREGELEGSDWNEMSPSLGAAIGHIQNRPTRMNLHLSCNYSLLLTNEEKFAEMCRATEEIGVRRLLLSSFNNTDTRKNIK